MSLPRESNNKHASTSTDTYGDAGEIHNLEELPKDTTSDKDIQLPSGGSFLNTDALAGEEKSLELPVCSTLIAANTEDSPRLSRKRMKCDSDINETLDDDSSEGTVSQCRKLPKRPKSNLDEESLTDAAGTGYEVQPTDSEKPNDEVPFWDADSASLTSSVSDHIEHFSETSSKSSSKDAFCQVITATSISEIPPDVIEDAVENTDEAKFSGLFQMNIPSITITPAENPEHSEDRVPVEEKPVKTVVSAVISQKNSAILTREEEREHEHIPATYDSSDALELSKTESSSGSSQSVEKMECSSVSNTSYVSEKSESEMMDCSTVSCTDLEKFQTVKPKYDSPVEADSSSLKSKETDPMECSSEAAIAYFEQKTSSSILNKPTSILQEDSSIQIDEPLSSSHQTRDMDESLSEFQQTFSRALTEHVDEPNQASTTCKTSQCISSPDYLPESSTSSVGSFNLSKGLKSSSSPHPYDECVSIDSASAILPDLETIIPCSERIPHDECSNTEDNECEATGLKDKESTATSSLQSTEISIFCQEIVEKEHSDQE